jgi:hypothetical protein
LREIAEGRWRNPALSLEAREKLSRPRKHGDNPVLHRAIERLRQGAKVADLTPEEREAHRIHRATLREARRDEYNAWRRDYYRRCMADPESRARLREKWQRQNQQRTRVKEKPPGSKTGGLP